MSWMILGGALLIVLIAVAVWRLRKASHTLDAIMAEHHERMSGTARPRRHVARHRLRGRRPRTVRTTPGYASHRRLSA